jgi:hypothetical protein
MLHRAGKSATHAEPRFLRINKQSTLRMASLSFCECIEMLPGTISTLVSFLCCSAAGCSGCSSSFNAMLASNTSASSGGTGSAHRASTSPHDLQELLKRIIQLQYSDEEQEVYLLKMRAIVPKLVNQFLDREQLGMCNVQSTARTVWHNLYAYQSTTIVLCQMSR